MKSEEFVYQITNKVTGDFYIGYTSRTPEERLKGHFKAANRGRKTKLYNSIRKYGEDNFEITPLYVGDQGLIHEKMLIEKLNPTLNLTEGGEGGNTTKFLSAADRAKMKLKCSKASRKYWDNISPDDLENRRKVAFGGNKFDRTYMKDSNKKLRASGVLKGSNNASSKLTEDQVRIIKSELKFGSTGCSLARKFGVTPTLISYIKLGKLWGWL